MANPEQTGQRLWNRHDERYDDIKALTSLMMGLHVYGVTLLIRVILAI